MDATKDGPTPLQVLDLAANLLQGEYTSTERGLREVRVAVAELVEAARGGTNHHDGSGALVFSPDERARLDAALAAFPEAK